MKVMRKRKIQKSKCKNDGFFAVRPRMLQWDFVVMGIWSNKKF